MFETLEVLISLAVVYLIFSMILKYLMSVLKRLLKTKANVISREMKQFFGEQTSLILIPYIEKKTEDLNLLDELSAVSKKKGLRMVSKPDLKEVIEDFSEYLKDNASLDEIKRELNLNAAVDTIKVGIDAVKKNLEQMQKKIENNYDNTLQKIEDRYQQKMRLNTLIGGLVLAVILNANIFEIYHSLSKNTLTRTTLTAQAEIVNNDMKLLYDHYNLQGNKAFESFDEFRKENEKNLDRLYSQLDKASLNLGWTAESLQQLYTEKQTSIKSNSTKIDIHWLAIFKILFGWFISGLLISFGAPFWHDFLSSITGLNRMLRGGSRSAGSTGSVATPTPLPTKSIETMPLPTAQPPGPSNRKWLDQIK